MPENAGPQQLHQKRSKSNLKAAPAFSISTKPDPARSAGSVPLHGNTLAGDAQAAAFSSARQRQDAIMQRAASQPEKHRYSQGSAPLHGSPQKQSPSKTQRGAGGSGSGGREASNDRGSGMVSLHGTPRSSAGFADSRRRSTGGRNGFGTVGGRAGTAAGRRPLLDRVHRFRQSSHGHKRVRDWAPLV